MTGLPAGVSGIRKCDLTEVMLGMRYCQAGHERVGWKGSPSSACWVCGRPWTNS